MNMDKLPGNGTLTVAGRVAAVFNALVSILGGGLLVWFGQNTLEKLDRMEQALYQARQEMATIQERGNYSRSEAQRTRVDLDATMIEVAKMDRRVFVLENRP